MCVQPRFLRPLIPPTSGCRHLLCTSQEGAANRRAGLRFWSLPLLRSSGASPAPAAPGGRCTLGCLTTFVGLRVLRCHPCVAPHIPPVLQFWSPHPPRSASAAALPQGVLGGGGGKWPRCPHGSGTGTGWLGASPRCCEHRTPLLAAVAGDRDKAVAVPRGLVRGSHWQLGGGRTHSSRGSRWGSGIQLDPLGPRCGLAVPAAVTRDDPVSPQP